jgi:hypothetical protein
LWCKTLKIILQDPIVTKLLRQSMISEPLKWRLMLSKMQKKHYNSFMTREKVFIVPCVTLIFILSLIKATRPSL